MTCDGSTVTRQDRFKKDMEEELFFSSIADLVANAS